MNKKKIALLSTAHFFSDTYHAFLRPIIPVLMAKFGASIFQGALLGSVIDIVGSFAQPFFGYFSDKLKKPVFIVAGPLLAGIFIPLTSIANTYFITLIFVIIGGIGFAAFHPQGAASVGLSSGEKKERGVAIFLTSGNFGYAVGPGLVVIMLSFGGLKGLLPSIVPAVVISLLLLKYIHRQDVEIKYKVPIRNALKKVRGNLTILLFIVTLRAVVIMSYTTFIPMLVVERGGSVNFGGITLFMMHLLGSISGLAGGYLAEKWGSKKIILFSFFIPVPFLYYYLYLSGIESIIILCIGFFSLFLSVPVVVSYAQRILPSHIATVSSFMMGFCWGAAGILLTPLGALADIFSIQIVLKFIAVSTVTGGFISLFLKKETRKYNL